MHSSLFFGQLVSRFSVILVMLIFIKQLVSAYGMMILSKLFELSTEYIEVRIIASLVRCGREKCIKISLPKTCFRCVDC